MFRKLPTILALVAVVGLSAGTANAAIINLDYGDSDFVGWFNPTSPADISTEVVRLNETRVLVAGTSTGTFGTDLRDRTDSLGVYPVAATTTGAVRFNGSTENFFLNTSFQYVLGKYDGPNAGDLIWDISAYGAGDQIILPSDWTPNDPFNPNPPKFQLSHTTFFNPLGGSPGGSPGGGGGGITAPEPTSTSLLLLGLGSLAYGARRRRKSQA